MVNKILKITIIFSQEKNISGKKCGGLVTPPFSHKMANEAPLNEQTMPQPRPQPFYHCKGEN